MGFFALQLFASELDSKTDFSNRFLEHPGFRCTSRLDFILHQAILPHSVGAFKLSTPCSTGPPYFNVPRRVGKMLAMKHTGGGEKRQAVGREGTLHPQRHLSRICKIPLCMHLVVDMPHTTHARRTWFQPLLCAGGSIALAFLLFSSVSPAPLHRTKLDLLDWTRLDIHIEGLSVPTGPKARTPCMPPANPAPSGEGTKTQKESAPASCRQRKGSCCQCCKTSCTRSHWSRPHERVYVSLNPKVQRRRAHLFQQCMRPGLAQ